MSEPLAERLSRFTPDAAGLDRDALLFAAGRASVRPSRCWRALAGILAASQLLTLVCLWPRTLPASPDAPLIAVESFPSDPASEAGTSELRAMRQRLLDGDLDYTMPPSDEPITPPDPPLHAFGTPPGYLLN